MHANNQTVNPVIGSNTLQVAISREVKRYVALYKNDKAPYLFNKFIIYAAAFCMSYSAIINTHSFLMLLFAYTAAGFLMILMGLNFAHDLSHNAIIRNKVLSNTLFEVIFAMMGVSGYLWKKRHISSHHQHPNHEGFDPDLEIGSIINLSPYKKAKSYHRYQHIYGPLLYASYTLYWIFIKDMALMAKPGDAKLAVPAYPRRQFWKLCFIKLVYLCWMVGLPYFLGHFSMTQVLLAFVCMHVCTSYFLLFTFLITHHTEHTSYFNPLNRNVREGWFYEQVFSSNDFHPFSKAANFIFGGFNCHIAHHLYPNTSHIYYPGITRIIYRHLKRNGITPNNTTYWHGICSHLKALKQHGVAA